MAGGYRIGKTIIFAKKQKHAEFVELIDAGVGTEADLSRAREESQGLGLFIRSLVGLDREAATAALGRYLSDKAPSASQIRFIQLIIEHLTANGVLEVARLYESPFTDNAPQGPDMIFTEDQVDGILAVLHDVRQHALPDATVAWSPSRALHVRHRLTGQGHVVVRSG